MHNIPTYHVDYLYLRQKSGLMLTVHAYLCSKCLNICHYELFCLSMHLSYKYKLILPK